MARTGCCKRASTRPSGKRASPKFADLSEFHFGMGRELFAAFRANALGAEQGAVTFNAAEPEGTRCGRPRRAGARHFVFVERTPAHERPAD